MYLLNRKVTDVVKRKQLNCDIYPVFFPIHTLCKEKTDSGTTNLDSNQILHNVSGMTNLLI
jgi:hypothetical protein